MRYGASCLQPRLGPEQKGLTPNADLLVKPGDVDADSCTHLSVAAGHFKYAVHTRCIKLIPVSGAALERSSIQRATSSNATKTAGKKHDRDKTHPCFVTTRNADGYPLGALQGVGRIDT